MTFWILLACQMGLERPDSPLELPAVQSRHEALKLKWRIDRADGSVRQLAVRGQWGESGLLAEQQFLLSPSWENLETWVLNDHFSPYPDQWSNEETSVVLPYLPEETQQVLNRQDQPKEMSPLSVETMWAWWSELRKAENDQDSQAQLNAAKKLRQYEQTHLEACLYLIRARKVHRDFEATGRLLKECQAKDSNHPSLKRQLADFYDGVGEHHLAVQIYTELGMGLHALAVTYQEDMPFEFNETVAALVAEPHLDAALHSVWLGIHLSKPELIRSGLLRLNGKEEPVAWAALGAGYLALNDAERALSELEHGDGVVVNALRARALLSLGQPEEAKRELEQALLMQPWNPWILVLLASIEPKYTELVLEKDPLESQLLGPYRDRYRPWRLIVPIPEVMTVLDPDLTQHLKNVVFNDNLNPNRKMCQGSRACWALWVEEPEQDKRWAQLSDVEKRFVMVFKSGQNTQVEDSILDRDWYAFGLHRLIVLKTDNLP